MKTLLVFWHGLGDTILATPALRKYRSTCDDYIGWMMPEIYMKTGIMDHCPYVDELHAGSEPRTCCDDYDAGIRIVLKEAEAVKREHGYDRVVVIDHRSSGKHKILRTADEMGVTLKLRSELKTEFRYDAAALVPYYERLQLPDEFLFFHGRSGVPKKDFPLDLAKRLMRKKKIDLPIVSPDFSWDISQTPIAFAADVMKRAKYRFFVDSSLYHIAHALRLRVDAAFFKRGVRIWRIVKPLHKAEEEVFVL